MMTVDEIMTPAPATLTAGAALEAAARVMRDHHVRHVPVIDDQGQLAGLVTQRDLLAAHTDRPLRVDDIMRTRILTVAPTDELRAAALTMQQHKIGSLPVIEDGKLVGIVTDSDYVGLAINLLEQLEAAEPPEAEADYAPRREEF